MRQRGAPRIILPSEVGMTHVVVSFVRPHHRTESMPMNAAFLRAAGCALALQLCAWFASPASAQHCAGAAGCHPGGADCGHCCPPTMNPWEGYCAEHCLKKWLVQDVLGQLYAGTNCRTKGCPQHTACLDCRSQSGPGSVNSPVPQENPPSPPAPPADMGDGHASQRAPRNPLPQEPAPLQTDHSQPPLPPTPSDDTKPERTIRAPRNVLPGERPATSNGDGTTVEQASSRRATAQVAERPISYYVDTR
jgi:hypothetical protein